MLAERFRETKGEDEKRGLYLRKIVEERRLCYNWLLLRASISTELTMAKSIVAITVLALSTSGALAAHRTHHHHRAMNAPPVAGAPPPMMGAPVMGGVSSADQASRIKSLRESGYNPKNDFNANGTIKTQ
jgi:hypothetical protein